MCFWCMGVDRVHPVAILSAVFCVVCSFCMCVCAMSGTHALCEYGSDVLFEKCCDVFFGVTVCSVCECSQDIQTLLGFSVDVICVLSEFHASI